MEKKDDDFSRSFEKSDATPITNRFDAQNRSHWDFSHSLTPFSSIFGAEVSGRTEEEVYAQFDDIRKNYLSNGGFKGTEPTTPLFADTRSNYSLL